MEPQISARMRPKFISIFGMKNVVSFFSVCPRWLLVSESERFVEDEDDDGRCKGQMQTNVGRM